MFNLFKFKKKRLPSSLVDIKKELKRKSKNPPKKQEISLQESLILKEIGETTTNFNQNNLTRTKAYFDFFQFYPEIHWAFLAHMVSRNGGWNMTDLKGEFLTSLLSKEERQSFFSFLERSNWLIFQDAFPQLLLYEASLKAGKNLFHLLPHLQVSTFMETVWGHFWKHRDSYILTAGLITNEQSHLDARVLRNPVFKKEVFSSFEYKLQDFLSLNHILFPYIVNGKVRLQGLTVDHFESLHERITLGKSLYALLFGSNLEASLEWANQHPHTGSRKDYWPYLFHDIREAFPGTLIKPRLDLCSLAHGSPRIYSPKLETVWKNKQHKPAAPGDWFTNWRVVEYLIDPDKDIDGEIESEYCRTLETIELAAIAKEAFGG